MQQQQNNANDGMELARQASFYQAKEMVMTAEQEAEEKEKLINEEKGGMSEKIESMIVMQKF